MIVLKHPYFDGTVLLLSDRFRPAGQHIFPQRPHILSIFHLLQDEIWLVERSLSRLYVYDTK